MSDFSIYFQPIDEQITQVKNNTLGDGILAHTSERGFPDLDNIDIALIGVMEERGAVNNEGCSNAPGLIRKYLYQLYRAGHKYRIADLGDIKGGNNIEDTYFALSNTVSELIKKRIVPVIIGGSQDITYANYKAYEKLEQIINMVIVDNKFNLGEAGQELNSDSFLTRIILHQPNFLFNYSHIGYQTYFVDNNALDLMTNLYFDVYRLGEVRADLQEVEPIVRNADLVSIDMSAVKHADAPGNKNATPNGFTGEELCQIARYAGLSDKLTSIGFYEINPLKDINDQTVHLTAQVIWYFIDGYYNRKRDFPLTSKKDYTKFRVVIEQEKHEIVFYKSKKSERWWMEVPYPVNAKVKYERHHLVPCSYADYQTASSEEIPDRWWKTYQKLS